MKRISLLFLLSCFSIAMYAQAVSRTSYIYAGTSPFQDSLWTFDVNDYSVRDRVGPTLAGFTITGMNGLATDPTTGVHYIILKVSGVSGRVLATVNVRTGVCTQIGNLGDNFATLAFNENGSLFGVTGDGASTPETMYRIDKATGAKTLFRTLGTGGDGEVITFCPDNHYFYHWSGNGTVEWERFDTTGTDAIQTLIYTGAPGGETFGGLYIGNGNFLMSNISSTFKIWDTLGNIGVDLSSNPDDIRGIVRQAATTIIDPWGPLDICAGSS